MPAEPSPRRPNHLQAPPQESLADFLASFDAVVADAAVRAVSRGDAQFKPVIRTRGESERLIREKGGEKASGVLFVTRERERENDAASMVSTAESSMGLLNRRNRQNSSGKMDASNLVSSAELLARAREKQLRAPSRLAKVWHVIRYHRDSPLKIMLDNQSKQGLAGGVVMAPMLQGSGK